MHLIGTRGLSFAPASSPRFAKSAVAPRSPVSMFACRTSADGTPKAAASASSTNPSFSPIRRSPVNNLITVSTSIGCSSNNRLESAFTFSSDPSSSDK